MNGTIERAEAQVAAAQDMRPARPKLGLRYGQTRPVQAAGTTR